MDNPSTCVVEIGSPPRRHALAALIPLVLDLWALTKPEVNFLIVIAAMAGFCVGLRGDLHWYPWARLLEVSWGTLLVASGAGALNQYLERGFDARMRRTSRRPLAAGRLSAGAVLWFGISLSATGAIYLFAAVNALAAVLALLTLAAYLFVYTPLKRDTPLCTLVGAVPGAMPPLIGAAAASGSILSGEAWLLFAVLFLWQLPHFMAIAWMYREDYAQAGYLILPRQGQPSFLTRMTLGPSFGLLIASLAACVAKGHGIFHFAATAALGLGVLYFAARLTHRQTRLAARQLLKATIIYLPLEFLILVLGRH